MKKTISALLAVATLAGSLAVTPANAQRGVAAGVAAGLIGGAIIGGAIASQPSGLLGPGPVYVEELRALPLGSRALLGRLPVEFPPRRSLQLIDLAPRGERRAP